MVLLEQNFHDLLRPGGVVNIGVRDYDYFINSNQKIYPRQVRVGSKFEGKEHIIFDVWEWHKGSEDQQLVNFNTFHVDGEGAGHTASKYVTTFRALFRKEMEQLMAEAGFVDIKVCAVWPCVHSCEAFCAFCEAILRGGGSTLYPVPLACLHVVM